MINCPECNKDVSNLAATCPNCGVTIRHNIVFETKSKKKIIVPIIIAVAIAFVGVGAFVGHQILSNNPEKERIAAEEQAEQERLEAEEARIAELRGYSSDVRYCVRAIITLRESMKDPKSLEIHNFWYGNDGNMKFVDFDASGTNTYGGVTRKVTLVTDSTELIIGSGIPNVKTYMYAVDNPSSSPELIAVLSKTDGIDREEVYKLLEAYDETGDGSLIGLR
jgi:hypothetical protein